MARKEKPKVFQGHSCIFCGGRPITFEHFYPLWTKPLIPNPDGLGYTSRSFDLRRPQHIKEVRQHQGYMHNNKIKVVCGNCNNRWMSLIETDAIPILTKLIKGETVNLDELEQLIIANWAILRSIIAEFTVTHRTIKKESRVYFMENKLPPPNSKVWIGKWNGNIKPRFFAHHPFGTLGLDRPNMQTTILLLNNLLVYTYYTQDPSYSFNLNHKLTNYLKPIYPYEANGVEFNSLPICEREEFLLLRYNAFIN